MERGVFAFACQYIVSPRGRTGNRTVTQMRHLLLVERRPNRARQSLASTLSAPRVAATWYCHPGRHANVITPCLLTPCLNVPYLWWSRMITCVPEGGVDFPGVVFLAGKCPNGPNLGRDSLSCCRIIGEESSSSVKVCRKTLPAKNFG